ncbi:MAG TPA: Ig-like domain repeat protein [Thermoanaerobaculia bacterium]|nr:Ig-like domain repeat protein [Thermoanaerobaculia bacterium]
MNRFLTRAGLAFVTLAMSASLSFAVTVVVTSTADVVTGCATTGSPAPGSGGCTLRDAILYSDANPPTPPARNLIAFDIPGSGVQLIAAASPLPPITAAAVVDGYTQPGASPNTQAIGSDAVILVSVRGDQTLTRLLTVSGGAGSVIRGLTIDVVDDGNNFDTPPTAVTLASCCNVVTGNFIGTDPSAFDGGVEVDGSDNVVGGPAPADRNVLGARGDSVIVLLAGERNLVQGNYIGVDASGAGGSPFAGLGVDIEANSNQVIGNVISEMFGGGVAVLSDGNTISGNRIGTDATGTFPLGNNLLFGVHLGGSDNVVGAANSTNPILGALFDGNVIAYAGGDGITDYGVRNSILSNAVFSNGFLGIDLGVDGVTPNDPGDGDTGANEFQNFPLLTSASGPGPKTKIAGTLNSAAHTTYRVQLFSNSSCDPSGYGEGETLVDEIFVTTNAKGNAAIHDQVFPRIPPGEFVTATATDPAGNTSEFSPCVIVTLVDPPPPPPFVTITRFLEEGPIRVAPGVPVEVPVGVGAREEARETPSGAVEIADGAGDACQATLIRTGVGACALTFASPGTYRIRAHYPGAAEFLGSDSEALVVKVKEGSRD